MVGGTLLVFDGYYIQTSLIESHKSHSSSLKEVTASILLFQIFQNESANDLTTTMFWVHRILGTYKVLNNWLFKSVYSVKEWIHCQVGYCYGFKSHIHLQL